MAGNPNENQTNSPTQIGISRLVEYFWIEMSLLQNMSAVSSFSGLLDWLPSPSHLMDRMMEVQCTWAHRWATQITQVLGFILEHHWNSGGANCQWKRYLPTSRKVEKRSQNIRYQNNFFLLKMIMKSWFIVTRFVTWSQVSLIVICKKKLLNFEPIL